MASGVKKAKAKKKTAVKTAIKARQEAKRDYKGKKRQSRDIEKVQTKHYKDVKKGKKKDIRAEKAKKKGRLVKVYKKKSKYEERHEPYGHWGVDKSGKRVYVRKKPVTKKKEVEVTSKVRTARDTKAGKRRMSRLTQRQDIKEAGKKQWKDERKALKRKIRKEGRAERKGYKTRVNKYNIGK